MRSPKKSCIGYYRKAYTRKDGTHVKGTYIVPDCIPKSPCGRGKISRSAYTRKAYTRKNGTHVSATRVKSKCIRGVGKTPGIKGPKLFTLKKGGLKQYGYAIRKPAHQRQVALNKAVNGSDLGHVVKQINALRILNRYKSPGLYKNLSSDLDYLEKKR